MQLLIYLVVFFLSSELYSQSFQVNKANDEYIVTSLRGSENYKNIKEIIRDKNGLYWFQNVNSVASFDGVNWKTYPFRDATGKKAILRINEIELTDDSTLWLATSGGVFGFKQQLQRFVPFRELFPLLTEMPGITNCIYKGIDNFLLVSLVAEGFFIFDWKKGELKHVIIDNESKTNLEIDGVELFVTCDSVGNYWGVTKENKGLWCYNPKTGQIKRSWRGELFPGTTKRLLNKVIKSITYSPKENALLLSYGEAGILEKLYLETGKSIFYSFSGNLEIRADTNSTSRYNILRVKVDPFGNEWVLVADKYLVKLDPDIRKCEYLEDDTEFLPFGKLQWILPESNMHGGNSIEDNYLLWLLGDRGLTVLRKRGDFVRHLPFDHSLGKGVTPGDLVNRDEIKEKGDFKNIFFSRFDDGYIILQQNEDRPKLLKFDKNLHNTHALFNDTWKKYPAYFNPVIEGTNFYLAILRPGDEPLDFRKVVVQDFKVDLQTMQTEEINLNFNQRIMRYGTADADGVYWLFSNGSLYSYDDSKKILDSIFICKPLSKKPFKLNRIKGFDFPTLLHKPTSTFWISFLANKELYKIDLKKRKIVKILTSGLGKTDYLPTAALQLHNFDSRRIHIKLVMASALLDPNTDSITLYSDLFNNSLPTEDHVGSFIYKDWICSITTTEINLKNIVTGRQKRLELNKEFKWPFSLLFFPPPVSQDGKLVLMSSTRKAFVFFNLDSVPLPSAPGIVRFSYIKLDGKEFSLDSLVFTGKLKLKYNKYNTIQFGFSDRTMFEQDKISYEYTLYKGGDTIWNKIDGQPEITFTRITPGSYRLLVRAGNGIGDYSPVVSGFSLSITPPFIQKIWFLLLLLMITSLILFAIYRYRLMQLKKLQIIRNNIASDLHDDIGSTLNSISIYSEVAKQQAGKELPALEMIGQNSRQIIESMSDIVWTINPDNDSFEKIIVRMRSFAYQLFKAKNMEYTFEAAENLDSIPLPMRVRKNFYLVFKEAITNIVKYSQASRIKISLTSENDTVLLRVQDNGKGIPVNAETQGNGLMNMKRRAEEISGQLVINSDHLNGTSIYFSLKI
jgi:signal transduction histidine kinase